MGPTMNQDQNLSHNVENNIDINKAILAIEKQIIKDGDLANSTVAYRLELLHELSKFELGKFIILNSGLNGYWIEYILYYCEDSPRYANITDFEKKLLANFPLIKATQQRCQILLNILEELTKENFSIASLPCGTGHELLNIKKNATVKNLELNFLDIDNKILAFAQQKASEYVLEPSTKLNFMQVDAWGISKVFQNKFNILVSSGLTIYEYNDDRILSFFIEVYNTLKANGIFIISTITLPPINNNESEWDLNYIDSEYYKLEMTVFSDVLKSKWRAFRSTKLMFNLLKRAGFSKMEVKYDQAKIFPNIIAVKA